MRYAAIFVDSGSQWAIMDSISDTVKAVT